MSDSNRRTYVPNHAPPEPAPQGRAGDPVEWFSTALARMTSRRGFLSGLIRGAVGLGIALAYIGTGNAFADFSKGGVGCAPQGSGAGTHPTKTSCGAPDSGGKYESKDNCHWNGGKLPGGGTDPSSNKYGCRPITGGFPYCKDVGQTCGNQDATKPGLPTCPGNTTATGYWTCCCDLKNKGDKGTTYTICMDCYPDAGAPAGTKKCTCLKAVPNGDPCKATP